MTAIGSVKEALQLEQVENELDDIDYTVEQLLAEGKVKRTVQAEGENYYLYYALKENSYEGMQGLGKGTAATLKDVFLIDDNFNVRYIDKRGKEYGDEIEEKILNDETEIRFASKAFSEYVSKISGVTEEEMKFKWMKNQTNLSITDKNVDSLEDLVFFPNLTQLYIGTNSSNAPNITTLDGVENCTKLTYIDIRYGPDKDYTALGTLSNLTGFYKYGGNDYNNIIDSIKLCDNLQRVTIINNGIEDMSRIGELGDLKTLELHSNSITKIEGLENKPNLKTLNLTTNKIETIEGLENLTNLEILKLNDNKITDITPLKYNTSLTNLEIRKNTGIDGNRANYTGERLEALEKIGEILDRDGTISIDVDKLGLFTNYKKLDLSSQNLSTLEPLEGLTQLTKLTLNANQITLEDEKSQEILKNMTKLEELQLNDNKITDVTAINNLNNLKRLYIKGTNNNINLAEIEDIISNLDMLFVSEESLKTIENCDVDKITKLSPSGIGITLTELPDLSKFTKLIELNLNSNNNISDLSLISELSALQTLRLDNTNLHERMIDFSKLTNLTYLDLRNNTLWSEDLENLKALKNNTNLTIDLRNNSIIDASSLLELDTSCKILLSGNVNLTQQSKDELKARFGSNVTF